MKKLVCGVGVNDANYVVSPTINGKREHCKFYLVWKSMITRCYSLSSLQEKPTYSLCYVDTEWHSFMAFRSWMLQQDFEGKELDKDLLAPGNKVYSKDTCIFISKELNNFTKDNNARRGNLPIGVAKNGKGFLARCKNPFTKTSEYLGTFSTCDQAHLAWKSYKHMLALQFSERESDPRLINILSNLYV